MAATLVASSSWVGAVCVPTSAAASPVQTLTWVQPPGYQSTLYQSQALSTNWSAWTNLGQVIPPINVARPCENFLTATE